MPISLKALLAASALSTGVLLSSAAFGQDPREACRDDTHAFCGNVHPGGGRIIDCLKDHYKDLSDDCYAAIQNMRQPLSGGNPPPPPPQNGMQPPPPPQDQEGNDMPPPPPQDGNNDGMQPPPAGNNGENMPPPPQGENGYPPPPPNNGNGNDNQ